MDIHLADGTGDAEYLDRLANGMNAAYAVFHPELVVYVAGADPYYEDQLGGLCLTLEGLAKRDRMVIDTGLAHTAAVAIVLAGGYAANVADTVYIQAGTAKMAKAALDQHRQAVKKGD